MNDVVVEDVLRHLGNQLESAAIRDSARRRARRRTTKVLVLATLIACLGVGGALAAGFNVISVLNDKTMGHAEPARQAATRLQAVLDSPEVPADRTLAGSNLDATWHESSAIESRFGFPVFDVGVTKRGRVCVRYEVPLPPGSRLQHVGGGGCIGTLHPTFDIRGITFAGTGLPTIYTSVVPDNVVSADFHFADHDEPGYLDSGILIWKSDGLDAPEPSSVTLTLADGTRVTTDKGTQFSPNLERDFLGNR